MVKQRLDALEHADAQLISAKILAAENTSLEHADFMTKQVSELSRKSMLAFIIMSAVLLLLTLFRISYLHVLNYASFDFQHLLIFTESNNYIYVMGLATAVFLYFMLSPPVFCLNRAHAALYIDETFQRRFVVLAYVVTLGWLVILSCYHHQVFYVSAGGLRSFEPALMVLLPLAYIGAMLVIPYFSMAMLFCLALNQILDSRSESVLMTAVMTLALLIFIGAVFFMVRKIIYLIAEIELRNYNLTKELVTSLNHDALLFIANRQSFTLE